MQYTVITQQTAVLRPSAASCRPLYLHTAELDPIAYHRTARFPRLDLSVGHSDTLVIETTYLGCARMLSHARPRLGPRRFVRIVVPNISLSGRGLGPNRLALFLSVRASSCVCAYGVTA